MGTPPGMSVRFESVASAAEHLDEYRADRRRGILLTADVDTMRRLVDASDISEVNLGGIHHRAGRVQRLRYVFLTPAEESALRELAARGVTVTAQDVPAAKSVPLDEVLGGHGEG